MKSRRTYRWAAGWLLPLMVLRAFVPTGYMPTWSENGLQLAMCSGHGPIVVPAAGDDVLARHGHHAEHVSPPRHDHGDRGTPNAYEDSFCPFSFGGSTGIPLPQFVVAPLVFISVEHVDALVDANPRSIAVLIDRIRGPPVA